jgi:hypothetical protein
MADIKVIDLKSQETSSILNSEGSVGELNNDDVIKVDVTKVIGGLNRVNCANNLGRATFLSYNAPFAEDSPFSVLNTENKNTENEVLTLSTDTLETVTK